MLFHLKQIDFTKEPYKSMIEPDDTAIYKEYVKLFCTYIAEPDEDGKWSFNAKQIYDLFMFDRVRFMSDITKIDYEQMKDILGMEDKTHKNKKQ